MLTIRNHLREKLAAGRIAVGSSFRIGRSVEAVLAMKTAGFDWLFLDMEHSLLDLETVGQLAIAAQAMEMTPIVRVPEDQHDGSP